jgi:hypothetical protein
VETLTVLAVTSDARGRSLGELLAAGARSRFRILAAIDAAEARDLLGSVRVDALLLDLNLPDPAALAKLRELRRAAPHLPLVVVAPGEDAGVLALAEGAQECLAGEDLTGTLLARTLRYACERVRSRAALRQSEEKFRTMADFTADWEYWVGPDRKLIYTSPSCERITGYRAEEFLEDSGLLERIVHPEDREGFVRHHLEVFGERGVGGPLEEEFRIVSREAGVRWLGHVCQAVVGRDGRPLGRRVSNRDITARKRAEEELLRLNAELEQRVAERTAELESANRELESFSYSVSHDLRAPLRTIDGFSGILEEEAAGILDEGARAHLARIREAGRRMGCLIEDLLRLSRVMRLEFSPVPMDLGTIAAAIVEELRSEHPERTVEVRIQPGLTAVGDRNMLTIALRNLLDNAWKYTGRTAAAIVELGAREENGQRIFFVRDNGAGFDMAYADRLFSPFQRLHSVEEFPGTGIGLATVGRIIHRHRGEIRAEGLPGAGATFSFTLGAPLRAGREAGA